MKQSWITGLKDEHKEEMKREFISSALLRARLTNLAANKIEEYSTSKMSKNNNENSNWAYLQADQIGYERALSEIISLLS